MVKLLKTHKYLIPNGAGELGVTGGVALNVKTVSFECRITDELVMFEFRLDLTMRQHRPFCMA